MLQELHEVKRKNSALQMQQFVGEEKNDLLDYLRSLKPEKVWFFLVHLILDRFVFFFLPTIKLCFSFWLFHHISSHDHLIM